MIEVASDCLRAYFSDGLARRPGDLEDDFFGDPEPAELVFFVQKRWRRSPFYPALARLIAAGEIIFGQDAEAIVFYAIPGKLPHGVEEVRQ